ncbi:MAG: hypothetical protein NC412_12380 [Roseburia sp.]|nr:hypothetical protein [Roseburia sp.]MCM1278332.1 hypothetical protein [Robinsoniella sp.]
MKKLWKIISVVLCGAMLLAGCGNSASEKGNSDTTEKQSAYTFSEIKKSGKLVVLFSTYNNDGVPAKDSVPRAIFIFDNGKVYGDSVADTTFGDYSKMTDEEIKQYVIENGRKSEYDYVDNVDYEIAVYTDSTGNSTDYESLLVKGPNTHGYIEELMYIYDNVTANATVYDSTYVGMNWQNNSSLGKEKDRNGCLWYRNNDGLSIKKDTPNVEGILVDPQETYRDNFDDR